MSSFTTKIILFFLCLHSMKAEVDSDCEGCLATVRAIERSLKKVPEERRDGVINHIMGGRVCRTLDSPHLTKEELNSVCHHLLDSHHDDILEVLKKKGENSLSLKLCYEMSKHCIGVKRHSFKVSKDSFNDDVVDNLLREHKENLRVTNPIHPDSPLKEKDEL